MNSKYNFITDLFRVHVIHKAIHRERNADRSLQVVLHIIFHTMEERMGIYVDNCEFGFSACGFEVSF